MRLQAIALQGFKSFAERTELVVRPGITAIVGPNGCGKTNIADALRWALGEQSAKALRGHRMEDVIFHGSASRRPLGFAEVLLTFTNDGDLPVAWSEVSVGRRLYRDGESEYLLNRTPCRLKDIHDLFLGTGLNPKAYALMEQERLAAVLTGKPLDRRLFIEEAAGITRYKQQRAETLTKLEATRQNLLRVRDVMEEVRRQLGSLERQARKARQYKALQAERRALELGLLAAEHAALAAEEARLGREVGELATAADGARARLAALEAEREAVRADASAATRTAADLREAEQRAALELEAALARAEQCGQVEHDLGLEAARLEEEGRGLERQLGRLAEAGAARREEAAALQAEFDARREQVAAEEAALHALRERLQAGREAAERLRGEQVTLAGRRAEAGRTVAALEERRDQLARRRQRLAEERQAADAEQRALEGARATCAARLAAAAARAAALQGSLDEIAAGLERAAAERAHAAQAAEECRVALASRRSSLAALEELEAARAGYGHGVQAVFAAARADRLGGIVGTVADLIDVPPELERAVEAALGERVRWIVVETFAAAKDALGYLGANGGGHATFLPLDWLDGAPEVRVPEADGVMGLAGHLVASRYPALVRTLLGSVVVVKDLGAAERLWGRNGVAASFVTLGGELLAPPGALGGGRAEGGGDASLLARKRAIRELRAAVAEGERALGVALTAVRAAEAELARLGAEQRALAVAREAAEAERLGVGKDLERLDHERERAAGFADALRTEAEALEREARAVDEELAGARQALGAVEAAAASTGAELARLTVELERAAAAEQAGAQAFLDAQVEVAALAGRLEASRREAERLAAEAVEAARRREETTTRAAALRARAAEHAAERARLETRAAALREARDGARAALREAAEAAEHLAARLDAVGAEARACEAEVARLARGREELGIRAAEVRVRRQDLEAEARRRFDVDPAGLAAAHDPSRDLEASRAQLAELSARIAALEPVNLVADEEYQELDERLAFLRGQHDDLTAAVKDLERALRGMTRTAQERFAAAFEAINRNFQELFARLFEGGRAELRLVEAEDPVETGVDVVAQPRGKRLQALSLLSGGEKALTGLALLFAIFYHRPSPFCLLDEVDAPLDDANIHRFTRVLRELATRTQFIVITHNRKTMEAADVLYGITMEEPGLSRVVSVNLA